MELVALAIGACYAVVSHAEYLRPSVDSVVNNSTPASMNSILGDILGQYTEPDNPLCPRVYPVTEFDLNRFVEHSWFVQMQQVTPYQLENQLYCVTATYQLDGYPYLRVFNYANNDEVNGPPQNSEDGGPLERLCGIQKREGVGELGVGPCYLRYIGLFNYTSGPYWVIAFDKETYEWAIVSGGQPNVRLWQHNVSYNQSVC